MVAIIKTEVHPFSARTVEDVISEYLETMAETNTVLVDHKVDAYKNWEGVDAERNTFTFHAYRGLVLRINRHYCSSMDMEWITATVATYDENGNFVPKEVGCDHADVDAPETVKEQFATYLAYQKRKSEVKKRLAQRAQLVEDSRRAKLKDMFVAKDLQKACGDYYYEVIKLLASNANGKLRSEFRKSLANQVVKWIDGDRKYCSPLSPKQFGFLNTKRNYY